MLQTRDTLARFNAHAKGNRGHYNRGDASGPLPQNLPSHSILQASMVCLGSNACMIHHPVKPTLGYKCILQARGSDANMSHSGGRAALTLQTALCRGGKLQEHVRYPCLQDRH